MLEIKPSSIPNAGLGVWSTEFIAQGTFVTEYYGEYLSRDQYELWLYDLKSDSPSAESLNRLPRMTYVQSDLSGIAVIGDPTMHDISRCGQFINDSCTLSDFCSTASKAMSEEVENYTKSSTLQASVGLLLENDSLNLYAIRDIPKGEELFQSYGFYYWSYHQSIDLPKSITMTLLHKTIGADIRAKKLLQQEPKPTQHLHE
jgi:SET domain-containing protein